jgi:hypothetical protein
MPAQFVLRVTLMSTARDPPVQITDSMMVSMRHAHTTTSARESQVFVILLSALDHRTLLVAREQR